MKIQTLVPMAALACITAVSAAAPAPEGAVAYFISPADGAAVCGPFTVRFGLKGMGVSPAGVDRPATGHHHLLIDIEEMPPLDQPLPSNRQVRHFGGGQTEVTLDLEPGAHTLQLLLGDHVHTPHDPPVMSDPVSITVCDGPD